MREGVLMFKLLLIAVAILAGASLSARAEDAYLIELDPVVSFR